MKPGDQWNSYIQWQIFFLNQHVISFSEESWWKSMISWLGHVKKSVDITKEVGNDLNRAMNFTVLIIDCNICGIFSKEHNFILLFLKLDKFVFLRTWNYPADVYYFNGQHMFQTDSTVGWRSSVCSLKKLYTALLTKWRGYQALERRLSRYSHCLNMLFYSLPNSNEEFALICAELMKMMQRLLLLEESRKIQCWNLNWNFYFVC